MIYANNIAQHCLPLKKNSRSLILHGKKNQSILYLIHNKSRANLVLTHLLGKDPGASAGWDSFLNKQRWSALLLARKKLIFNCQKVTKQNRYQKVPCGQYLTLCRIGPLRALKSNLRHSSFWISENHSYRVMSKDIKRRGI